VIHSWKISWKDFTIGATSILDGDVSEFYLSLKCFLVSWFLTWEEQNMRYITCFLLSLLNNDLITLHLLFPVQLYLALCELQNILLRQPSQPLPILFPAAHKAVTWSHAPHTFRVTSDRGKLLPVGVWEWSSFGFGFGFSWPSWFWLGTWNCRS